MSKLGDEGFSVRTCYCYEYLGIGGESFGCILYVLDILIWSKEWRNAFFMVSFLFKGI